MLLREESSEIRDSFVCYLGCCDVGDDKESDVKSYLLKDIDDGLWREVKAIAAKNDEAIRDVIERAIVSYLEPKSEED